MAEIAAAGAYLARRERPLEVEVEPEPASGPPRSGGSGPPSGGGPAWCASS